MFFFPVISKVIFPHTCPSWLWHLPFREYDHCLPVTSGSPLVVLTLEEWVNMTCMFPWIYHFFDTCLSSIILHGTISLFQVVIKVKITSTCDLTYIIYHSCNQHSLSYFYLQVIKGCVSMSHGVEPFALLMVHLHVTVTPPWWLACKKTKIICIDNKSDINYSNLQWVLT